MIGNIIKGESFGGLLSYLFEKEAGYKLDSNMVSFTPADLAIEFEIATDLRPEVKKPVYHVSLSIEPGEHLSDDRWREAILTYLERMGFNDNQYVAIRHNNRPHEHCHIVVNRINLNGYPVNTYLDYHRSEEIIRDLEKQYGLTQLQNSWETTRRQQPKNEIKLLQRTQQESVRRNLQQTINDLTTSNLTMPQFLHKLRGKGIKPRIHFLDNGEVKGISYQLNGINYPGHKLGRGYSFNGLQKYRDISYSPSMKEELLISPDLNVPVSTEKPRSLSKEDLESLDLDSYQFSSDESFEQLSPTNEPDFLKFTTIESPEIIAAAIDASRIMYGFIEKYGERLENGDLYLFGDNWICNLKESGLTVSRKLDNQIWLDIDSEKLYVFNPTPLELSKLKAIQQHLENVAENELDLENGTEYEL